LAIPSTSSFSHYMLMQSSQRKKKKVKEKRRPPTRNHDTNAQLPTLDDASSANTQSIFPATSPSSQTQFDWTINVPVAGSILELTSRFETSASLRDEGQERPNSWQVEEQDNSLQTEFDSELSFLCERIRVEEDDPMKLEFMPYIS
jgi:hypothetical protein